MDAQETRNHAPSVNIKVEQLKCQNENMLMYNAVGKGLALAELVTTLSDIGGDATIVRSGEEYINALNAYAKSVPKPPKTATSAYTSFRFTFFSAMTKVAW
eukprot:jgi/Picre1/31405/NNA_006757.t1